MPHILAVGGGGNLQPRLRRAAPNAAMTVLCRASVLRFVCELHENEAVVILRDSSPLERWLAAARAIHAMCPVDTVVSLAEVDQDKAAAIAADLGMAFHSPETVECVYDKHAMRRRLHAARLENLPFRQVRSPAELAAYFARVGPPLLLKPTKGKASLGIAVIRVEDDIAEAFKTTSEAREQRLEPSIPLAERYIHGPEFSVEAITHHGTHYVFAITEKFKDEETKVEIGHVVPARLEDFAADRIVDHVRACLDALGIGSGITHSEVILGDTGPVLVETHLRPAGDQIPLLVQEATGADMTEILIRQIAGADIGSLPEVVPNSERPRYSAAAAIWYLKPQRTGTLAGIDGLEEIRQLHGVCAAEQLAADGTVVRGLRSSYDRLAAVRVRAADAESAVTLAARASERLVVRYAAGS